MILTQLRRVMMSSALFRQSANEIAEAERRLNRVAADDTYITDMTTRVVTLGEELLATFRHNMRA